MAKRIAIITGASSGLGKEFLKALLPDAPDFDEIWIIARRLEKLSGGRLGMRRSRAKDPPDFDGSYGDGSL